MFLFIEFVEINNEETKRLEKRWGVFNANASYERNLDSF